MQQGNRAAPSPRRTARSTLVVDTFGEFGYKALVKQYETEHPNVKVELRSVQKLDDYKPKLVQYLAAGSGAGDVVALEEGILNEFKTQPQNFVNLLDHGAAEQQANFLPWKWELGKVGADGPLIGLGTDVGGLAVCYRKDLFAKAEPADRPRRRLEALAGLGRVHRHRQEVRRGQHRRQGLRRLGHAPASARCCRRPVTPTSTTATTS